MTRRKLESVKMDQIFLGHFNLVVKSLEIFGLWRFNKRSNKFNFKGCASVIAFVTLNFILPLINLVRNESFDEEAVNLFLIFLGPSFKVMIFLLKIKSIENLLQDLTDLLEFTKFEENSGRKQLRKHVKLMRRLFVTFCGLVVFSILLALALPLFENRLPYKSWIPYNRKFTDKRQLWIFSTVQILLTLAGFPIAVCLELLPTYFVGIASVLLVELSMRLKAFSECENANGNHSELVKCVKIHVKIKEFVSEIQKQFSIILFVQGFVNAALMCFTAFVMSTVGKFIKF